MIKKFRYSFTLLAAMVITIGAVTQSPVGSKTAQQKEQTDFCTGLQQIVADYPNDYKNIRGKRLPPVKEVFFGEVIESDPNAYKVKITPGKVVEAKVNIFIGGKHGYSATIVDGITTSDIAMKQFRDIKKKIEKCPFPFITLSVDEKDDHVTIVPVGSEEFEGMKIMLRVLQNLMTDEYRLVLNVNPM